MEDKIENQKKDEEFSGSLEQKMEEALEDNELENTEGGGNIACHSNGNCNGCTPSQKELQENTIL